MILVIEDNDVLRQSLQEMVEGWGFETLSEPTGEEALNLCSPDLPLDAIVTDYRFGDALNGVEAALEIRQTMDRNLPTLLTGDTGRGSLAEIRASGFGSLHKPIDPDVLLRKLAEMLGAR
jgi:two-component system, sensor histidine kinase